MFSKKDKFISFMIILVSFAVGGLFIYLTEYSEHAKEREKQYNERIIYCDQFRNTPEKDTPVRCIDYIKWRY